MSIDSLKKFKLVAPTKEHFEKAQVSFYRDGHIEKESTVPKDDFKNKVLADLVLKNMVLDSLDSFFVFSMTDKLYLCEPSGHFYRAETFSPEIQDLENQLTEQLANLLKQDSRFEIYLKYKFTYAYNEKEFKHTRVSSLTLNQQKKLKEDVAPSLSKQLIKHALATLKVNQEKGFKPQPQKALSEIPEIDYLLKEIKPLEESGLDWSFELEYYTHSLLTLADKIGLSLVAFRSEFYLYKGDQRICSLTDVAQYVTEYMTPYIFMDCRSFVANVKAAVIPTTKAAALAKYAHVVL